MRAFFLPASLAGCYVNAVHKGVCYSFYEYRLLGAKVRALRGGSLLLFSVGVVRLCLNGARSVKVGTARMCGALPAFEVDPATTPAVCGNANAVRGVPKTEH